VINTVLATVPHARKHYELSGREQQGDDAFDGARQLLIEALELSRGQRPAPPRQVAPAVELREELRVRAGARVLVVCPSLTELAGLLGADPTEVLRVEVLGRGHRLTVLHHDQAALSGPDQHLLAGLVAEGADVRLLARSMPEAVLVDDDLALLPADPVGSLVRSPEVVRALRHTKTALLDLAVDFAVLTDAAAALVGPSSLADVLGTLCAGMKDETAARQMRVSVRTYRRYVASILKSLNVTSRFEAGMRLTEIGLTDLARRREAVAVSGGLGGPGGAPEPRVEQAGGEHGRGDAGEAQQHDPYRGDVE
jgi:hypothetical protein